MTNALLPANTIEVITMQNRYGKINTSIIDLLDMNDVCLQDITAPNSNLEFQMN